MWDDLSERLVTDGYRVLRYDMLGHGRTPALAREIQLEDLTAQLASLLQDLRIRAAVLVGFSLGALVARAYAVADSARLSHLVLLNSVYARTQQQREAVRRRYEEARDKGPASLIDAALQRWFSAEYLQQRPDVAAQVRERLNNNEPRGFLSAYRVFANALDETEQQLSSIDVPTLVITGALDVGSTPAMSEQLAQRIPKAHLRVLPGARHMLPVERADWLNDALQEFLSEAH